MTAQDTYTLWGSPHSYYTGKIRSYLIKKRIPYREFLPSDPDFQSRIVPTVRHMVVPVMQTPDGRIIQDTTDMIEHLEAAFPESPMIPQTPVQRALAWLLGAFGSEALLPPGMHYRWSYRSEQERFLRAEFGRLVYVGPDRDARDQAGLQLMEYFNGFLPVLGVNEETTPAVEQAYCELLEALDQHFQEWPYLLGGRPSIADFGFMAPLYAHLARDPVPATLMKNIAPNVYRWTERMNATAIIDPEFPGVTDAYPPDDAVPETLGSVLRLVFQDWGAQLTADAAHFNDWVARNPSLPAGHLVSASGERLVHPTLGYVEYPWRGCTVRRATAPHGLWHFEKAASIARELAGEARTRFDDIVRKNGGEAVMKIRLGRAMRRADYVLVLA
jgi:glutathione S-transferase